eukprot:3591719-Pleurochrysis_carterae.AAC.2
MSPLRTWQPKQYWRRMRDERSRQYRRATLSFALSRSSPPKPRRHILAPCAAAFVMHAGRRFVARATLQVCNRS